MRSENVMILITGASGNVGKEVLKQVAQTKVQVRAAFQSASKAGVPPPGVEIVTVDYNQPQTLRAALKGVERASLVGPPTAQLPALEGKAMEVIAQSDVRQVVKLSAGAGAKQYFRGSMPNPKTTSSLLAFLIRFFGPTDLCRTSLTTMHRPLTHRTRFMEAKAMAESARSIFGMWRQSR